MPTGAFNASFVYQENAAAGNPADGVAFVLQNSSSGAGALGGLGVGLGYSGITPSAAVEINIYAPNTIGTAYATNGAAGPYTSTTATVNPASGDPIAVTLSYNGASSLTETMSDTVTGQTYSHTYATANIASAVGGGLAYIGFTGGDGGATSNQFISNFSYQPVNILPVTTALSVANGGTLDITNCLQTVQSLSSTDGLGSQVLLGNGAMSIANTAGTSTTFDGVISGMLGAVTLQGGSLMLTNQNTFTGPMTVSGTGVLQLNSAGGPALAGNLAVSGGTAVWLRDSQVNSGSNLAVSSGLANIGTHSNTVNNVQITGGTITGTSGVLTSTTDVDARSGTINAILGGTAGLAKSSSAGTVVLGAANTYSGGTSVGAGKLTLANPLAAQNSTVSMNGGVLAFTSGNTSPSVGALSGGGNLSLLDATSNAVTLSVGRNNATTTYSGIMSGGGSLVKQGGGTFQLANFQSYGGPTVVSSGVLQLGPVTPQVPYTVSNFGDNTTSPGGSNSTWQVNNNGSLTNAITNNVLTITYDDGVPESRSAFYNTQVPVGAFQATFVYTESTGYTYPTNGATFVLQNSTSGLTALGGSANGLGYTGITPSAGIGVNPWFNSNYDSHGLLWLQGGTVVSSSVSTGAFPNSGHPIQVVLSYDGSNMMTTTWTDLSTSGTYTASYAMGNLASVLGTSAYIGFTGAADSTDGAPSGYATQTFGNFSYTYTAASAPFTGNNVLPTLTPLSVATGGTVDLYGGNDAVGSLSGAGTVTNSVAGSLSVLSVGNIAGLQTFSGSLQDGGGTLGLHIVAPGGLVLTGQNNTYSGATTINGGGTLQLGTGVGGNDGSIAGAGGVNNNGLLLYNLAGNQTASYAISGSGAVTKTGGGTLTLANGSNTYAGGTNVLQGLMVVAPVSGALPYGPLYVSGGSLDLEGNSSFVASVSGNGTIGNGQSGAGNLATLFVLSGGTDAGTFTGTIRDGGFGGNAPTALQVLAGTLTLAGTDTYTGGTVVNGGTLVVTNVEGIADNTDLTVGDPGQFPAAIVPSSPASAQSQGVAPVPEPGTLALLAALGAALAAAAWGRGCGWRRGN